MLFSLNFDSLPTSKALFSQGICFPGVSTDRPLWQLVMARRVYPLLLSVVSLSQLSSWVSFIGISQPRVKEPKKVMLAAKPQGGEGAGGGEWWWMDVIYENWMPARSL